MSFRQGGGYNVKPEKKVIVVGAAIGGLAAAIALRQSALQPVLFERAPELREVGAGLSLWPNALKALGNLGLADSIRALSIHRHPRWSQLPPKKRSCGPTFMTGRRFYVGAGAA